MGQIYQQLTSISLCKQDFLSKEGGHLLLSWPALAPSRHFITCQAWYCAGISQTLSPSARNRIPFVTSKCDLANWRFPKIGVYPQIILTGFSSINHPFGGTVGVPFMEPPNVTTSRDSSQAHDGFPRLPRTRCRCPKPKCHLEPWNRRWGIRYLGFRGKWYKSSSKLTSMIKHVISWTHPSSQWAGLSVPSSWCWCKKQEIELMFKWKSNPPLSRKLTYGRGMFHWISFSKTFSRNFYSSQIGV